LRLSGARSPCPTGGYERQARFRATFKNNIDDIFVHDRATGVTERVSVDSSGNGGSNVTGWGPISADGRFVAFLSLASDLVAGDTNGAWDVFVHDRQTGITERVSVDSAGNQANFPNDRGGGPAISADGRFVAFASRATNLVAGDTNGTPDVFVHDRQTGITERVNIDSSGNQSNPSGVGALISVSADGRFVAFESGANNLVEGVTNNTGNIFVHDRQTGITERVSGSSLGNEGDNNSTGPLAISADGRFVAFPSSASNLVSGGGY
jgi:Tol biopolymer transport system component